VGEQKGKFGFVLKPKRPILINEFLTHHTSKGEIKRNFKMISIKLPSPLFAKEGRIRKGLECLVIV
jgi:hypothetical protein